MERTGATFCQIVLIAVALAGCDPAGPQALQGAEPAPLAEDSAPPPPDAPEGTCFARTRTPVRIETITEHIEVRPATTAAGADGASRATYRTQTSQRIAGGGEEMLIETPCKAQMTAEFVASAQRALAARGLYGGTVSGTMDGPTRAALRQFQQSRGLDSAIMSMTTARDLGLIAYEARPRRVRG